MLRKEVNSSMKRVIRSELKKRLSNQVPSVWSETAFHIHKQGRVPQRTWWWQSLRLERCTSLLPTSCPMTQQSLLGQNVLNIEDTRSHTTPQSVGLLWTSDRPVDETSTWQHTTLITEIRVPVGIRNHNLSRISLRFWTQFDVTSLWLSPLCNFRFPRIN